MYRDSPTPMLEPRRFALRVAGGYLLVGCLWILLSDRVLHFLVDDPKLEIKLQTLKGWFYVSTMAAFVYIMVHRDAVLWRNADRERHRRERDYRRIVETAFEGIATLDPAGNIMLVNQRLVDLLGVPREELIGRPFLSLVRKESHAALHDQLHRQPSAPLHLCDLGFVRPDGGEVWVLASICPLLDEEEKCIGTLLMLMDVSDRRQLEARLAQSERLEAMGQLAGGVAHDFNNILTVILGHVALLRAHLEMGSGHISARLQDLELIERSAQRAVVLTRQLRTFSRRRMVRTEVLDLRELIKDMQRMLDRALREDITLTIECEPEAYPVRGDAGQIEQVLLNLVINARDAMPQGGEVTVGLSKVTVDADAVALRPELKSGDYNLLTVSDTGTGIDPKHLPHIYEPFYTTKPVGEGTGLGLATAYSIIHQMNGYITVDSELNKGTTFSIYLPAAPGLPTPAAPAVSSQEPMGGSETILVCEDNAAVRQLTCQILSSYGYRVLEEMRPESALERVRQGEPPVDMLLTDIVMPGMNGRQLAEKARQARPAIKVLFVSGYTANTLDGAEGEIDLLEKPFTGPELLRRVRQVLNRGR